MNNELQQIAESIYYRWQDRKKEWELKSPNAARNLNKLVFKKTPQNIYDDLCSFSNINSDIIGVYCSHVFDAESDFELNCYLQHLRGCINYYL